MRAVLADLAQTDAVRLYDFNGFGDAAGETFPIVDRFAKTSVWLSRFLSISNAYLRTIEAINFNRPRLAAIWRADCRCQNVDVPTIRLMTSGAIQ